MKNLKARVGRGSLWITATRGAVNILGLISTIALARLLVPDDFGLVAIGTTMLAIITQITDMQLTQAIIRHQEPTRDHLDSAWTLATLRGLVLGAAFAAAGPVMARFYDDPRLSMVMVVLGGTVAISGMSNPRRVMLQRDLIFWQDFLLNVSQKLIGLIASVAIAYYYHSYWALLVGAIISKVAMIAISYMAVPYLPRVSFSKVRELWSFSFWLTLSQIVNTLNWRFDQLLIGKILGARDLGLYTIGDNFAKLPTREVTAPLTGPMFPAFARIKDQPERLRRAYQRAQTMVTALALPLGVGTALVAHPLILILMGEKWMPAALVIQILASIFALQTLGSLAQPLMMAIGQTRLLFRRDLQLFFLRLPILIGGMYLDGLRGMLIGRTISGIVAIAFNMQMVRRFLGIGYGEQLHANIRTFAGLATMAIAVVAVQSAVPDPAGMVARVTLLIGEGLAGGFAYFATCALMWVAAGRPDGPESEVAQLVGSTWTKLARARTI